MFTGIVESTVKVLKVTEAPGTRRLTVPCPWADARLGQSVAVNGCCLTIAGLGRGRMDFDVVKETLEKTNLGMIDRGGGVHLERSLMVGDRLDGHIVQGHVDGVARLVSRKDTPKETRLTLAAPAALMKYIIPKGSVCLDGVSLTVAAVRRGVFDVALIPTTLKLTALGDRKVGYGLNLETDIVAKTIVFWLESSQIPSKSR